jgi:hypothetical protein
MLKQVEVKIIIPARKLRTYLPRRFGKCRPSEIQSAIINYVAVVGALSGASYRFVESAPKLVAKPVAKEDPAMAKHIRKMLKRGEIVDRG